MESIDPRRLLAGIAKILNRLKIPYLVTGGMAVYVWGRPTEDVESVFKVQGKDLDIGYLKKQAAKLEASNLLKKFLQ